MKVICVGMVLNVELSTLHETFKALPALIV